MHPRTFHFSMHSWRVTHSYFTTFHSHLFAYALLACTCIHVSNPHSIADNFIIPQPTFYLHSHTYLHSCLLILILFSCKILIIFVFFWIFVFKKIGEKKSGKKTKQKNWKKNLEKNPVFFSRKKEPKKTKWSAPYIRTRHSHACMCIHVHSYARVPQHSQALCHGSRHWLMCANVSECSGTRMHEKMNVCECKRMQYAD